MTAAPLVSVLMTAYNREAFIAEAIESVLASSFGDFELLVVDDASRDDTAKVARSYAQRDARVKVHVNETNLGDYPNRNRAASFAQGKYLKYLDSDDWIYPHGLAVMVGCMERFPTAGFGLSAIADARVPYPTIFLPRASYRLHFTNREIFGRAPGSAIIKRSAFWTVGGFSGRRFVGDQELWLKLGRTFPLVLFPRDLVWDRTHGSQERVVEGDDIISSARGRFELEVSALEHVECPLSEEERNLARQALSRRHAETFWRYALRQLSPCLAMRFRRALQLSWAELFDLSASRPDRGGRERATP